jgi:predicted permease
MKRFIRLPSRSAHRIRDEVDEELAFHIQTRTDELSAGGASPADARAQALREFGDVNDARQYLNRIDRQTNAALRRRDHMGDLRQDIFYALRTLRRSPGFTLAAVATLALGIGANTAIFSVVNGVLFKELPFPRPDQLYRVWSASPSSGNTQASVSAVDLDDWRAQRKVIADMGGYWYASGGSGIDLTGSGDPLRVSTVFFSPGFFATLGITPSLGRVPRDDEAVRGGPHKVVMLTHAFWQRQFSGSPGVVDSSLTLGGEPYAVLGVLPPDFRFPATDVDVFVPFSTIPDDAIPRIRPVRILAVVARARDGVSEAQVNTEMNAITARLAREYEEDKAWGAATVQSLRDAITGSVRRGLLVLLGAVAFVLLIACVNVASLLLARASVRSREVAVRMALGANRGRLVRQLLTESMVLAFAGGAAGVLVAIVGVRGLVALSAGQLPRGTDVRVDAGVLVFAVAISLVTGLLFGLVPALRAASGSLQSALRSGGRGFAGSGGQRLRNWLVVAEVGLAMILVIGGGLMIRSFQKLLAVDPGFDPDRTVVLNFSLNTERHENFRLVYQQMLESVRAVPGVLAAGSLKDAPFRGTGERNGFTLPGMVVPAGEEPPVADVMHVSEGVFKALAAKMIAGREFVKEDRQDAPLVVVINEAFAARWFPGEPAVGKRVLLGNASAEVIGVVNDIRQRDMAEPAEPTIYIHNLQNSRVKMNIVVRTRGDPLSMVGALRAAVWNVDRAQPITSIFTLDEAMSGALARPRLLTVLLGVFGLLGLTLGALGLYGVLAYLVNQRQREIGVRLALGADRRNVLLMVVRHGFLLALAGVAIGTVGALAMGRFIAGVLYNVEPADPATMAGVAAMLLLVAVGASLIPARRAASVDPIVTLRQE